MSSPNQVVVLRARRTQRESINNFGAINRARLPDKGLSKTQAMQSPKLRYLSDIACYSYSPGELRRCIRKEDFWRYKLAVDLVEDAAKQSSLEFYARNCTTGPLAISRVADRFIFRVPTLSDALCIRRTDQILRRTLRTAPPNRDDEIRQLLSVLRSEKNRSVCKADIQGFFESVDFGGIISKLEADGLRNSSSLNHLRSLHRQLVETLGYHGLPRGLSISSTLADYVLQDFDTALLNAPLSIYCCRYVDDICVVHFSQPATIEDFISKALPDGLKLNNKKTVHVTSKGNDTFPFLGYSISVNNTLTVRIADTKINKAKKRIILSFRDFVKTSNFALLFRRMLFLSSTIEMQISGRITPVYSGFRHVYRYCTPHLLSRQMVELDRFFQAQITSQRFWLSRLLRSNLTSSQLIALRRVSFYNSYKDQTTFPLSRDHVSEVKKAWKYEQ